MQHLLKRLVLLAATSLVAMLLSGCFLTDVLSPSTEKPSKSRRLPPPDPTPVPLLPGPEPLSAPRLARRVAIDLSLSLPSSTDVDTVVSDLDQLPVVIDTHLASAASSLAIARLHPRIWGLTEARIPALDAYVEAGDAALGTALSDTLRRQIVDEPVQMVRYALDSGQSFASLFTSGFTILHPDAAAFWDLTTDSAPWPGEPLRFATYPDDRPSAGLLVANALLAGHPAPGGDVTSRAAALLENLACTPLANPDAHLFYDLTSAELAGDLAALALTKPTCASCHAQIDGVAAGLAGLGAGGDVDTFKTYAAPSTTPEGFYAGHPFAGLQELGARFGNDPRVHRCEIEKMIAALYQRPFSDRDRKTAALALDAFYANGMDLKAAARRIATDPEFGISPLSSTIKGMTLYMASGVHVLGRAQWQGLVEGLVPGAVGIEYPEELDAGSEETMTQDWMVPTGSYWHAVDRVARQAATAIVEAELADDALTVNRRLFKDLPDGAGNKAELLSIYAQIRSAWQRITGEELSESSPIYFDFQKLWSAVDPKEDAEAFRTAWRTLLVAMLTHPQVVTY